MPEGKYFLKLTGAFLLGLAALVIAGIIFLVLLPVILAVAIGLFMLVAAFVLIWVVVYVAMILGAAIYYFFKPMKVEEKDKGYSVAGTKEAGMREKGRSRKKK